MVLRAAELLGCDRVVIVNLLAVPATDVPAMSVVGPTPEAWTGARPALAEAVQDADVLLAAWGRHPRRVPLEHPP